MLGNNDERSALMSVLAAEADAVDDDEGGGAGGGLGSARIESLRISETSRLIFLGE